jgi:hypothetical protein
VVEELEDQVEPLALVDDVDQPAKARKEMW